MKFYGEPNLTVMDAQKGKFLFKFNEKGEYETEDARLIEKLKHRFKYNAPKRRKE